MKYIALLTIVLGVFSAIPISKRISHHINSGATVLETFPILQTVIETILVYTDGLIDVEFQQAFCNGRNFTIYDNDVFIATVQEFEPRFCGINTSSYIPIVDPKFVKYNYLMPPGQHNLTVVVMDSPLMNGQASLRITFKPMGAVTKYQIISARRRTLRQ